MTDEAQALPRNAQAMWAWINSHTDREFWNLVNAEPAVRADVAAVLDQHMDYLIASESAALYRAETRFGC